MTPLPVEGTFFAADLPERRGRRRRRPGGHGRHRPLLRRPAEPVALPSARLRRGLALLRRRPAAARAAAPGRHRRGGRPRRRRARRRPRPARRSRRRLAGGRARRRAGGGRSSAARWRPVSPPECFEGGRTADLLASHPSRGADIERLAIPEGEAVTMPAAPPPLTRGRPYHPGVVPEARLEETDAGLVPAERGMVRPERARRPLDRPPGARAERPAHRVDSVRGRDLLPAARDQPRRPGPGEPIGMYHWEADQEDFLVLSGEALLIVEGEERPLRQWDFVHCPPGTRHMIVGAGRRPLRRPRGRGARAHRRELQRRRLHGGRGRAPARRRRRGGDERRGGRVRPLRRSPGRRATATARFPGSPRSATSASRCAGAQSAPPSGDAVRALGRRRRARLTG